MSPDTAAVLLAAGRGLRIGGAHKALLPLGGQPLLAHGLRALRAAPSVAEVVVVLPPAGDEALRQRFGTDVRRLGAARVVEGGAERWESSRNGCAAASPSWPYLLIHDAARPFLEPDLVEAVVAAARAHGAALAARPLADTLKRADGAGLCVETVPRDRLWRAQTPQAFRRELLVRAFAAWNRSDPPTDDAALVEALGVRPALVPAPAANFKITTPEDLALAEGLLRLRGEGAPTAQPATARNGALQPP